MFTTFTVTKAREPKKILKNLFVTKHVLPKKTYKKKEIRNNPIQKQKTSIVYKTQKLKEPKKEIENKKEEKIEPKIVQNNTNIIIQPKMPCNLFCIFHNQNKIIKHCPKNPEPLLQKKRIIEEETGNKIGRWRPEEHKKFIEAIIKFGNNWKDVQKYIDTRTSTQARSHAQKYFEKMKKNKYLKFFKPLNIDYSENFTNSTIMQLHKLYGNKSKNEINSIVNKFINMEYDNQKKKRRNVHPYIGNKKQSFNGNKNNNNNNMDVNESVENEEENDENVDMENNNNINENNNNINYNYNNLNRASINYDELYGNNNSQKNEEESFHFNDYLEKTTAPHFRKDGIKYILKELVRNVSQNYCEYEPFDPKPKCKRKNTFGSYEEEESAYYDDNLAYKNQYNNAMYNNNNQNMNVMNKSRKNSLESFKLSNDKNDFLKLYQGFEDGKLSYDNNEILAKNIFNEDKDIQIEEQ